MADYSWIFGAAGGRITTAACPAEPEAPAAPAAPDPAGDPAADALARQVEAYAALAPEIASATPLPAEIPPPPPVGRQADADRLIRAVTAALTGINVQECTVQIIADAVTVDVRLHPAGADREAWKSFLLKRLTDGKAGVFNAVDDVDPHRCHLVRRDVVGPGLAWRDHGDAAAAFFNDRDGQRRVFTLAGLSQTHRETGDKRYPKVHAWGEDDRGGTAELRLPPKMLLADVVKAQPALRQAFNAPNLAVSALGVHPLIRLNTRAIAADFPAVNPMSPRLFVQPRTQAERHAAAPDFVLPLGVRANGQPVLINQDEVSHLGVFGSSGTGKTYLLTSIIRAAVLQGASVILIDAKNGKDLRGIALQRLPGVVNYSAGCDAGLHRAVLFAREELDRRQALAAALQQRGIAYRPTPMVLVFDEAPAWIFDRSQTSQPKAVRDAATATVAHLSYLASQARESRIFVVTAGQFAYAAAFSGDWKANTRTLVHLGEPSEINRLSLFNGDNRDTVRELGSQLTKKLKGRGLVADSETGRVELIQGFFNPPGKAADAFNAAVAKAPRLRRIGWQFPMPGEPGGDGSWQQWTAVSDPASDSLPAVYLDRPDGTPDPATAIFDLVSPHYSPGARKLRAEHLPV